MVHCQKLWTWHRLNCWEIWA